MGSVYVVLIQALVVFLMVVAEDMVDDLPRSFFNRFVRGIKDLPTLVLPCQFPHIFDLGKDLPEVAVAGFEIGILLAHPSDLLEDFGVDVEADDLVLINLIELLRQVDARNNGYVGDFVPLLRQEEGGRRFGCSRESDEHDIRLLQPLRAPAVIVAQGVFYGVDALEVAFIDLPEQARGLEGLQFQVGRKRVDERAQDVEVVDVVLPAVLLGKVAHLFFDEGEGDKGLVRLRLIEKFFEPGLGIDIVEDHDLGARMLELHQGRPQNVQTALAGGIGKDVDVLLRGHGASPPVLQRYGRTFTFFLTITKRKQPVNEYSVSRHLPWSFYNQFVEVGR